MVTTVETGVPIMGIIIVLSINGITSNELNYTITKLLLNLS